MLSRDDLLGEIVALKKAEQYMPALQCSSLGIWSFALLDLLFKLQSFRVVDMKYNLCFQILVGEAGCFFGHHIATD